MAMTMKKTAYNVVSVYDDGALVATANEIENGYRINWIGGDKHGRQERTADIKSFFSVRR